MSLDINSGLASANGRAELFTADAQPEQDKNKGKLYIFLASEERSAKLEKIADSIKTRYFNSTQKPLKAIETVVKAVNDSLLKLNVEVEIAAISITKESIYCACVGGVQVSVLRGTSFATILKSVDSVITAEGKAKSGDVVVLLSKQAVDAISGGKIQSILGRSDLEKSVVKLEVEIGDDGSVGLLVFSPKQKKGIKGLYGKIKKPGASEEIVPDEQVSFKKRSLGSGLRTRLRIRRKPSLPETREEARSRKTTLIIGIILLLLLVVSMSFGIYQKNKQDVLDQFEPELIGAVQNLDSAIELSDISPSRAMADFVSAKQSAEKLKGEGVEDERLVKLLQDIEDNEGKVLGTYKVESQVFLDLPLLSDPFEGDDLFLTEQTLLILDKDNKKIASVELDSKRAEVVAGPSVVRAEDGILGYAGSVYISSNDGISEIEEGRENIIKKDWDGNYLASAYAGNIYVLAKDDANIFRFPAITGGFAGKQGWLKEGLEPDFSDIISWAIDGSMWLLSSGGRIFKYGLGIQQDYNLGSVPTSLSGATQIYTDENSEHIYILLPDHNQVLVVDKEGEYQALYESDEIQFARDIAVSEGEKKIIVLTGDKLYEIEARHLQE